MLPLEGIYFAHRTGQSVGQAKTGTPQVAIKFDATHIDDKGDWLEIPRPIAGTVYLFLSDAAFEYSKPKLVELGFNGRFDEGIDFSADSFAIECKHETYNGVQRAKWEFPRGSGELKPLDKNQALRLSTLFRAGAAATPKPKGKPASPPSAPKDEAPASEGD